MAIMATLGITQPAPAAATVYCGPLHTAS